MRLSSFLASAVSLLLLAGAPALADAPSRSHAVREADGALHVASLAGRRLLGLLDDARRRGDARQVACVDVKLTQVNSFARTLSDRRTRLVRATRRGDEAAARHERRVIGTLHAQVQTLEREGRACVFPGAGEADGRTVVEVLVDGDVPDEDPALLTDAERRRGW